MGTALQTWEGTRFGISKILQSTGESGTLQRRDDSLRVALTTEEGTPKAFSAPKSARRKNGGKDVPAKSMGGGVFTKARIARFLCISSTNVYISVVCKVGWLIPPPKQGSLHV